MFPKPKKLLGRLQAGCKLESFQQYIKRNDGLNFKLRAGDDLLKVEMSNQTNFAMDYHLGNCVHIK